MIGVRGVRNEVSIYHTQYMQQHMDRQNNRLTCNPQGDASTIHNGHSVNTQFDILCTCTHVLSGLRPQVV